MAKVEWSAGIDSVSGALSKPGKNGQHTCAKMLLGTHRIAATESPDCNRQNPDCTRLYIRKGTSYERTNPLSSKELDARARFTAVAAAVKARKSDLNQITTDQINFAAQKDQAGGKKTMRAYLWLICGQAYDAEHNG